MIQEVIDNVLAVVKNTAVINKGTVTENTCWNTDMPSTLQKKGDN